MQTFVPVPPHSLDRALAFVKTGGRLCVRTVARVTVIDAASLGRFEKAGEWLLKEEGDSYRLRRGRGSVYLLPGQLEAIGEGLTAVALPGGSGPGPVGEGR